MTLSEALALAIEHHQSGRLDQAGQIYQQILQAAPEHPVALHLLGLIAHQTGRHEQAVEYLERALRADANQPVFFNTLGAAYGAMGRTAEAAAAFLKAIELDPDFAEAYHNLGTIRADQGNLDDAAACFQRAIQSRPGYWEARNRLGIVLFHQGKLAESVACFQRALAAKPDYPEAHNNLGLALKELGHLDDALASFGRAIDLKPDYPEARWNRSLVWLLQGNFDRGWPEYECRWRTRQWPAPPSFSQPRWDGGPLAGKTLLVSVEQGLGDTVQFARYAELLKQQGAAVVLQCPRPLVPLVARCPGIDRVVAEGDALPPFDVYAPLLSIPGILKTTLETIPCRVPYLFADPSLIERWREKLNPWEGLKVGITWQGNPRFPMDRFRSIPLVHFAPLAEVSGVRLINLQQGAGQEQLSLVEDRFPVADPGRFDPELGAFNDRAAILMSLDLLVTSDTAIAHVAGALGVPVWLALAFTPDWRWLLGRDDSPWYPTVRLFRQPSQGDWPAVFERIKAALLEFGPRTARHLDAPRGLRG